MHIVFLNSENDGHLVLSEQYYFEMFTLRANVFRGNIDADIFELLKAQ